MRRTNAYGVIEAVSDLVADDVADGAEVHVLGSLRLEEDALQDAGGELCGRRRRRRRRGVGAEAQDTGRKGRVKGVKGYYSHRVLSRF